MKEHYLNLPLTREQTKKLNIGDVLYLSGTILTARDKAHKRILEYVKKIKNLPFTLENSVIFHTGPVSKKIENSNKWRIFAIGPTTSSRMDPSTPEIIEKFNVPAIIGKGGMDAETAKAMKKHSCVYLAMTGGVAAITTKQIKEVRKVHWLDLGLPEAVYELEVENLGPLIVAMDAKGKSLYSEKKRKK